MSAKQNMAIRILIMESGLKQWEIADRLGFSEEYLSRILRRELPKDKQNDLQTKIKEIVQNER